MAQESSLFCTSCGWQNIFWSETYTPLDFVRELVVDRVKDPDLTCRKDLFLLQDVNPSEDTLLELLKKTGKTNDVVEGDAKHFVPLFIEIALEAIRSQKWWTLKEWATSTSFSACECPECGVELLYGEIVKDGIKVPVNHPEADKLNNSRSGMLKHFDGMRASEAKVKLWDVFYFENSPEGSEGPEGPEYYDEFRASPGTDLDAIVEIVLELPDKARRTVLKLLKSPLATAIKQKLKDLQDEQL